MHILISWLKELATTIPLPVFVFLGSILEELVPPIPTPLIMSFAGYLTYQRGGHLLSYLLLAFMGACGKSLTSVFLYSLGKNAQNFILSHPRLQKFFGLNQANIGKTQRLLAHHWWDEVLLVFLSAVPLIPTFIVSFSCGVVHLPLKAFIPPTFIGTFLRNCFLLWLGVYGTEYVRVFWEQEGQELSKQPLVVTCAVIGLCIGVFISFRLKKYFQTKR